MKNKLPVCKSTAFRIPRAWDALLPILKKNQLPWTKLQSDMPILGILLKKSSYVNHRNKSHVTFRCSCATFVEYVKNFMRQSTKGINYHQTIYNNRPFLCVCYIVVDKLYNRVMISTSLSQCKCGIMWCCLVTVECGHECVLLVRQYFNGDHFQPTSP